MICAYNADAREYILHWHGEDGLRPAGSEDGGYRTCIPDEETGWESYLRAIGVPAYLRIESATRFNYNNTLPGPLVLGVRVDPANVYDTALWGMNPWIQISVELGEKEIKRGNIYIKRTAHGNYFIPSNFATSIPEFSSWGQVDAMTVWGPMLAIAVLTAGAAAGVGAAAGTTVAESGLAVSETALLTEAGETALIGEAGETALIGGDAGDLLLNEAYTMDDILVNDVWGTEDFALEDWSFPNDSFQTPDIPGIDSGLTDLVTEQNTLPLLDNVITQAGKLGASLLGKVLSPQTSQRSTVARAPVNPFFNPLPGNTGGVFGGVNDLAPTKTSSFSSFSSYLIIGAVLLVITFFGLFLSRR
jgi:hypothetical protein